MGRTKLPVTLAISLLTAVMLLACSDATTSPSADDTSTRAPSHDSADCCGADSIPDDVQLEPAPSDDSGREWQRLTVEGVSVDVPKDWRADIVGDPCSTTLERWILLQEPETGTRMKIDLTERTVDVASRGSEDDLEDVLARIRVSFEGRREVPPPVKTLAPFPTFSNCDPDETGVPTLRPLPTEPPPVVVTARPEPTMTPVTPPAPPPPPAP